ncbi:MAG: HlyD family efflux transporter periplasmic adaptor subunit, partial [Patescibacteria group bacterium]|nr:HlyD family efflux transporter periplasmic adaptor subunit [Patescibacteria group bacterium]
MTAKIIKRLSKHKAITIFSVVVIIVIGYFGVKALKGSGVSITYALASVEKGTVISSVSGSGQVSASDQIEIKSKASGDALYVGTKAGQSVKSGTVLVQLDSKNAQKSVRDAQTNLDSAKLSLQKLQQPPDSLSLLQAQDALVQANQSKQNALDDLAKTYEDGFNTVSNAFLDLPTIMTGLDNILHSYTLSQTQMNLDYYANGALRYDSAATQYRNDAEDKYQKAKKEYDQNFTDYKSTTRFSSTEAIESLVTETYNTTKDLAEAVKSTNNLIQFYKDKLTEHSIIPSPMADTHLTNLNTYTSKTNSSLSSLLSIKTSITDDKQAITNADATIAERTASLAKLQAGTDPLDIQSQQLSIKQKENALLDAKQTLTDYSIRAPIDGTIAELDVKKGDSVSSGTTVAIIISKQSIAEIPLNEVDVSKVKIGQKATLTFDAIEGLNISGQVAEIDTIGTVSQGVVNYNVKITFDTEDTRVKPGMSVSAAIITDIRQDVLVVSNSAIKSSGDTSYVEIPLEKVSDTQLASAGGINLSETPKRQIVVTGLSDDSFTEITSGLNEGDQILIKTIANGAKTSS